MNTETRQKFVLTGAVAVVAAIICGVIAQAPETVDHAANEPTCEEKADRMYEAGVFTGPLQQAEWRLWCIEQETAEFLAELEAKR